ncbi:hypothetical protein QC764_0084640 [Podospora pseudoanserina]|uniref:Uncharacterized protein n=1 Tax=Podospora pseudoanserina TaxID=2609844 RepID=A0ABR0I6Q8_9PEZI|nr:hypothetical protein QC764_0084640 [Podospora pseudoanserina]
MVEDEEPSIAVPEGDVAFPLYGCPRSLRIHLLCHRLKKLVASCAGKGGPEKALGQSKKFTFGLLAQSPGSFPNQGPNSVNVDSLRRCIVTPAYGTRIVVNIEEAQHLALLGCYFAREVIGPHGHEQARFPEGLRHAARQLPRSILAKTLVRGALLEYFKLNEYDGTKLNFQFSRRVVASLATDALFSPVPTPPRLAYLDLEAAQRRRDKSISLFRSRRLNSPVARAQHKRQRRLRPAKDIEDPYIAAVLIALAQEQSYQDQSRPDHYKVHLLAAKDDNLYFYTALIPSHFLDRLDRPSQRYPTS